MGWSTHAFDEEPDRRFAFAHLVHHLAMNCLYYHCFASH